jgi:hypothetical protein
MAKFFRTIHTLGQFREQYPEVSIPDAISLTQRLVQENLLEFVVTYNSGSGEHKAYETYYLPPEDDIQYGVIDCLVFGFAYVRDRFKESVIPLMVNENLGTGFLIEGNIVLTAGHCLMGPGSPVSLRLVGSTEPTVIRAVVPKNGIPDIGALILGDEAKNMSIPLRIGRAGILDDVMALGYRPSPDLPISSWHRRLAYPATSSTFTQRPVKLSTGRSLI